VFVSCYSDIIAGVPQRLAVETAVVFHCWLTVHCTLESEQHHAPLDHLLLLDTVVFLLLVCDHLYHVTHLDQHRESNAEDPSFATVS